MTRITVEIDPNYMGLCWCGEEATHKQWCTFDNPIAADPAFGLPEVKGLWEHVCDEHVIQQ